MRTVTLLGLLAIAIAIGGHEFDWKAAVEGAEKNKELLFQDHFLLFFVTNFKQVEIALGIVAICAIVMDFIDFIKNMVGKGE